MEMYDRGILVTPWIPVQFLCQKVWISVYPKIILSTLSGWNKAGARAEANQAISKVGVLVWEL